MAILYKTLNLTDGIKISRGRIDWRRRFVAAAFRIYSFPAGKGSGITGEPSHRSLAAVISRLIRSFKSASGQEQLLRTTATVVFEAMTDGIES